MPQINDAYQSGSFSALDLSHVTEMNLNIFRSFIQVDPGTQLPFCTAIGLEGGKRKYPENPSCEHSSDHGIFAAAFALYTTGLTTTGRWDKN